MSEPVELAFREQLAARFAEELEGRVFDLVSPPEAKLPLATYQRTGSGGNRSSARARIQVTLRDEKYAEVKRLQKAVEVYLGGFRRGWMGSETCVWVHDVRVTTLPDRFLGATRHRVAVSEFDILYAG